MILRQGCAMFRFVFKREIFAGNMEADLEGGEIRGEDTTVIDKGNDGKSMKRGRSPHSSRILGKM